MITKLVYEALICEVELTPKPGLVDKINSGSHKDMDIHTFYKSAYAISPFIEKFLTCKSDFEQLREVGLECEKAMFIATDGVNTHKGMIFSLAVFCGAIGSVGYRDFSLLQEEIRYICKDLIKKDLADIKEPKTHGERFYVQTKLGGIRAEAVAGYPSVFQKALPFLSEKLKYYSKDIALKLTLLFLMSEINDSTLFARGGITGLKLVQEEAKKLLNADVNLLDENLKEFDSLMRKRNLSAGGSADLLALSWLVYTLQNEVKIEL